MFVFVYLPVSVLLVETRRSPGTKAIDGREQPPWFWKLNPDLLKELHVSFTSEQPV